jgi:hypothetical protein
MLHDTQWSRLDAEFKWLLFVLILSASVNKANSTYLNCTIEDVETMEELQQPILRQLTSSLEELQCEFRAKKKEQQDLKTWFWFASHNLSCTVYSKGAELSKLFERIKELQATIENIKGTIRKDTGIWSQVHFFLKIPLK